MAVIHKKLESFFEAIATWVYAHGVLTLIIIFLMSVMLAAQLPRLTMDTRDQSFFHPDDPTLVAYDRFRYEFGQDDIFFIAMKPEKGLTPSFFKTMRRLHRDLEKNVPYLDEVDSLINGRIVRADNDTLIVEDLIPEPPETRDENQRIIKLIDHYPLYEDFLVSGDRTLAMIMVKAQAFVQPPQDDLLTGFESDITENAPSAAQYLDNQQNIEINDRIREIVDTYRGRGIEFFFAGTPVFAAELQRGLEKDLGLMTPLSFLLIIIFLSILFRRVSGVIYPMIIVMLSLISSLGLMAVWGIPISNAIMILPTFLIVVGVGDAVHILTIFYRNLQKSPGHNPDKKAAIICAVGHSGLPVLMTSLTTACGLLSFVWADVAIISHLGYIAPAGVMIAFLYTLFLLPALVAVFPIKTKQLRTQGKPPVADRIFDGIAKTATHKPLVITAVWTVLFLLAALAAFNVRFSHNAMSWLPHNSTARVGTRLMDQKNGGTVMLEVIIDAGRENGLHDPDLLLRMDQAGKTIPTICEHNIRAGKVVSMVDVLKETNRALNEDIESAYIVPDTRQLAAQELILFESSGSDDLAELADGTYQKARMSVLAPFTDSILYKDYVEKIKAYLDRQFPHEAVTLTGHMALFIGITKMFITSMAKSYLFAFVAITLMMMVMMGNFKIGLMSMIANIVPIVMIFGIMGTASFPIDMVTILVGSIVLGLVVDDTIHFLHHFRRAYDVSGCVETAVKETLHNTGRALVITSIVLCGGFLIYTTAYLSCYVRFGILTASAVLFALTADLVLLPALLALIYKRREPALGAVAKAAGQNDIQNLKGI
ncbi:efflux RND transporter permease subunit [Desulfobacter curvatus]|uniref:efflux RND transporter permease subunit n=1 Tax=Desulfobacter curvatus TaxID=2290 RepID=UPI00036BCCC4|nr:efflux RND transporter permease subunit [Desulfobacter curvatus]